jgi:hypothetical protein
MSINSKQLRLLVVRPTLEYLNLWSESAENLLLGTCAQESSMGAFIKQVGGPALGIYQMEPATQADIGENFLAYKPELAGKIAGLSAHAILNDTDNQVVWNLAYATALCRVHYLRVPSALPPANETSLLAAYWKQHYNTPLGKGTEKEFVENYTKYVT